MLLCCGGFTNSADASDDALMFDVDAREWLSFAKMSVKRKWHSAATLSNGKVIVTGGNDGSNYLRSAEMYNPSTNRWLPISDMMNAHYGHAVAALNDAIYVLGGYDGKAVVSGSVERYDEERKSWQPVTPLLCARKTHAAAPWRVSVIGFTRVHGGPKTKAILSEHMKLRENIFDYIHQGLIEQLDELQSYCAFAFIYLPYRKCGLDATDVLSYNSKSPPAVRKFRNAFATHFIRMFL